MNTKQQGDIGVAFAIAYYTKIGYGVSVPLTDNLRYDLIVDDGIKLNRIQVKTTFYMSSTISYEVHLKTCGGNQSWNKENKYISEDETDFVFVYCGNGDMYHLPSKLVAGKGKLILTKKLEEYRVSM